MVLFKLGNFSKLYKASAPSNYDTVFASIGFDPKLLASKISDLSLDSNSLNVTQNDPYQPANAGWQIFTQKIIPHWKTKGQIHRSSICSLFELIDQYFPSKDKNKFLKDLLNWAGSLREYDIQDINYLYAQTIELDKSGKRCSLIESLVSFFSAPESFEENLFGIARWLCEYDASFISQAKEFEFIYVSMKLGPGFDTDSLKRHLLTLPTHLGDNVEIKKLRNSIELITANLEHKKEIDSKLMSQILEIFRIRWRAMRSQETYATENPVDYLAHQAGINETWIRLAQIIAGAGLLPKLLREEKKEKNIIYLGEKEFKGNMLHFKRNYYGLLMPTTMDQPTNSLLLECAADSDFKDYIIADDGTLIDVKSAAKYYLTNGGFFYNCSGAESRYLTPSEIIRLAHSNHAKFCDIATENARAANLPVTMQTYNALKCLVEGTFVARALKYDEKYDDVEMRTACTSYHLFYNYLWELSRAGKNEEITRLHNQLIRHNQNTVSVGQLLRAVKTATDTDVNSYGCAPTCSEFILVLLLSYNEEETYSPEVTKIIDKEKLRMTSRRIVFSDYDWLDQKDAERRLMMLLVFLMTHFFQYSWLASTVSIWDCSNTMVEVTSKIFKWINQAVAQEMKDARYVYVRIMEGIVKPELQRSGFFQYEDTKNWLESINSDSFFKQNHLWFKPESLMLALKPLLQNPSISAHVQTFLDELLHTYLQKDKSALLKEIRVNIHFQKFMEQIKQSRESELLRAKLLADLNSPIYSTVSSEKFQGELTEYLLNRVVNIGATSYSWICFFKSTTPQSSPAKKDTILKILCSNSSTTKEDVIKKFRKTKNFGGSVNSVNREAMQEYIDKVTRSIASSPGGQSTVSPITTGSNQDLLPRSNEKKTCFMPTPTNPSASI